MPKSSAVPLDDRRAPADDPAVDLQDLAALDMEATADEVRAAVHWVESHTLKLERDTAVAAVPSVAGVRVKRTRRGASSTSDPAI
jgi:hypothetical protein